MQKVYKAIIVGGGASGLVSAIELASNKNKIDGKDILVLEKLDRVAKKLIATGNGQANLSNANLSVSNYYGDTKFISDFFDGAKNISVKDFFMSLGLPFYTMKDGRQYPLSRQANAVVDILRYKIQSLDIEVKTNYEVTDIAFNDGLFTLSTANGKFFAKKVILAVGGKAGKQYGTDGSAYSLAEKFGHKTTKLYPSLVQVKTDTKLIKGLKGIKEQAKVYALDGDKVLKSADGDLLFTEYGVSGSAVFQVSGHLNTAVNPVVKIEFLPDYSLAEVEQIIQTRLDGVTFIDKSDLLIGIVNKKLGQLLMSAVKSLTAKEIAKTLKDFRLSVKETLGFNYAQVTKGGITTIDVNPKTCESSLKDGLYLTGEYLDVDGDCGGYNLTFAFLSGMVSAIDIKSKI